MSYRCNNDAVLELCCFEWFQNPAKTFLSSLIGFRAVLFRMVPKRSLINTRLYQCFRAVLFRMVPKHTERLIMRTLCFRAVLFRMVPKPQVAPREATARFRAVLFRMVPKLLAQFGIP